MLRNYLRVAIRNLTRNRFSAAINIGGLAVGMAVAVLIGLWVFDELSFDRSIPNHDRIAAVMQNQEISGSVQTWWGQAKQLAPALRKDFGSRFRHIVRVFGPSPLALSAGDTRIKASGAYVDPEIADMLSLDMVGGDRNALRDESSIILSASVARNLFGTGDPMGKIVKVNNDQPLKVTGVYTDLPGNTSFAGYGYIIPFTYLEHTDSNVARLYWGNSWFNTYVQLNDKEGMAAASLAIKDVKARYAGDANGNGPKPALFLHPMNDWHLYSDFRNGVSVGGAIQYVRLFTLIGIFVLLLACINFMNLSTARSEKRAKEVGIRKAIGSLRGQLIGQFFSESLLIALLSFILAIGLVVLLLPLFSEIAGKKMSVPVDRPLFWVAGVCFVFMTGILAGSYPALYLSSFRPVKVLKGTGGFRPSPSVMKLGRWSLRVGRLASAPRKVLVVLQFTVSVILIIGTIAVFRQIQYVKDRPVGYSRDGLVMVPVQSDNVANHYDALRTGLQQTGLIEDMAGSASAPTNIWATNGGYSWHGKDPSFQDEFVANLVTPEFGKVTGWQIVQGRDFTRGMPTTNHPIIVNETAVRYMNLKNPIGEVLTRDHGNEQYTIIGVVKDMINESPFEPVRQMIFGINYQGYINNISIRVEPHASMARALDAIKAAFKKYDPSEIFEYQFADQEYAKKFGDEERVGRLAGVFTTLAILISCLGLLGLSAFVAEQRTREVGIRKVLGASVFTLWRLLSREFIGLVGLSLLIGGPVASWIMAGWLSNYHYHAGLSWWIFAATAGGVILVTLLTVSWQAVRAAMANPVESLRAE
jgi:ABC-type antimicrobial peptide transport system permease subunit